MTTHEPVRRHDHLTFKGNLRDTRYGWLRLTPAYSVHLVADLLDAHVTDEAHVLDPFCGTGTTALVCAERGIRCDTTDINPFLLWLTGVKTHAYSVDEIESFRRAAAAIAGVIEHSQGQAAWVPPIHQIEKWWDSDILNALGHAMAAIARLEETIPEGSVDLLKIAFCRVLIESSNASFGHQSMSFKRQVSVGAHGRAASFPTTTIDAIDQGARPCAPTKGDDARKELIQRSWQEASGSISHAAQSPVHTTPRTFLCDARNLTGQLPSNSYDCVITSPPYPNRMSYIRELRPYMYWLGYLQDGRQAGELDWQAIGGTWGVATSNVAKWMPEGEQPIPYPELAEILDAIAMKSPVLSRYVHKYFADMVVHARELYQVVRPGGTIHYIVGNSRFYDVLVPVEQIFAALFSAAGFSDTTIEVLRKRTSKKELFEYLVSARK